MWMEITFSSLTAISPPEKPRLLFSKARTRHTENLNSHVPLLLRRNPSHYKVAIGIYHSICDYFFFLEKYLIFHSKQRMSLLQLPKRTYWASLTDISQGSQWVTAEKGEIGQSIYKGIERTSMLSMYCLKT